MAAPISAAAKRYLDASSYGEDRSGKFFASRPGKMVGNVEEQRTPLLQDATKRNAAYRLIVELAGGTDLNAMLGSYSKPCETTVMITSSTNTRSTSRRYCMDLLPVS